MELKDLLTEDNNSNIRNMTQSNHNHTEIFSYLKAVISRLQRNYDLVLKKNRQLQRELCRLDPNNDLLVDMKDRPMGFGEAGVKLGSFVPLKARFTDNFGKKIHQSNASIPQVERQYNTSYLDSKRSPNKTQRQASVVQDFISNYLVNYLVVDPTKKVSLPKSIIFSLYHRWNEGKGRVILLSNVSIKSLLTNTIKQKFPNIDHNQKFYRGLMFREDIVEAPTVKMEETNTDYTNPQGENQMTDANYELDNLGFDLNDDQLNFD